MPEPPGGGRALVYVAPDGTTIDQYFYVGIVTGTVEVTPY
jgi:hypothetical protein